MISIYYISLGRNIEYVKYSNQSSNYKIINRPLQTYNSHTVCDSP